MRACAGEASLLLLAWVCVFPQHLCSLSLILFTQLKHTWLHPASHLLSAMCPCSDDDGLSHSEFMIYYLGCIFNAPGKHFVWSNNTPTLLDDTLMASFLPSVL